MANYLVKPTLTNNEKSAIREWLSLALGQPEFCVSGQSYPINGKLCIYRDGKPAILIYGNWGQEMGGEYLRIGTYHASYINAISKCERLAVLGVVISLTELWEEFRVPYYQALGRSLVEQYNQGLCGLVDVVQTPTSIAFNGERNVVAVQFQGSDEFYLPGGTEAVALDETWHRFSI